MGMEVTMKKMMTKKRIRKIFAKRIVTMPCNPFVSMVTEVLEIDVKWKCRFAKKASMPKVSKMENVRIAVQKDVQMKKISFVEPMKLLTKTNVFYKRLRVKN